MDEPSCWWKSMSASPAYPREMRYEITPSELIAVIRAHCVVVPAKPHADTAVADPG